MGLDRGRGTDKVPSRGVIFGKSLGSAILTPQKFRRQLRLTTLTQNVEADYEFPNALSGTLYVQFRLKVNPPAPLDEEDQNDVMRLSDGTDDNFIGVGRRAGDLYVYSVVGGSPFALLLASPFALSTWIQVDLGIAFQVDGSVQIDVRQNGIRQGIIATQFLVPNVVRFGTWGFFTANHELANIKIGTDAFGSANVFQANFDGHTIVPPFTTLVDGALDASGGTLLVATDDGDPHYAEAPLGGALQRFILFDLKQDPKDTARANFTSVQSLLLPGPALRSYHRTQDAQTETIDEQLVPEDTPAPTLSALIIEADQDALGDGNSVLKIGTVDSVFGNILYERSRPVVTPEAFIAKLPTFEQDETDAGTANFHTLALGDISISDQQTDEYRHRTRHVYRDLTTLPVHIIGSRTTAKKQVETVDRTLELDTATPALPTDLLDVTFTPLGDGTAVEEQASVQTLFTDQSWQTERPDAIIRRYRAIAPLLKDVHLTPGTAALPTLADGELMRQSDQINEFVKRDLVQYRDLSLLPVHLTDYKMTRAKQVATVVLTLAHGSQTITPDYLTEEADVQDLGDGTSLKTFGAVDELFTAKSSGIELLDLVPPEMRAHVPTYETDLRVGGPIVDPPVLTTGDISKIETQEDEFTKRVRTKTRAGISLPVNITNTETTEEYGGGVLNLDYKLETSGYSPIDTGLLVTRSSITDLGNGTEIKQTRMLDDVAWPILSGQEYDDRFDVVLPFTQQVVDAGTGIGTPRTHIRPIDVWRQENRTIDITDIAAVLDVYVLQFPGTRNLSLPPVLVSVNSVIETHSGDGDTATPTWLGYWTGHGAYSVSVRAEGQASAAIVAKVMPIITQSHAERILTTHYLFFLPDPVSSSDVMTRLVALVGGPVLQWPVFHLESAALFSVGQKSSLRVGCDSHQADGGSSDSCECSMYTNNSASREVGLLIESTHIPPTVHGDITITGPTSDSQNLTATADASISGSWGTCGCAGGVNTRTETDTVNASITSIGLGATTPASIPISGIYLLRADAEPYKYGYVSIHAEVFDASVLA
jgi:hypothetical protein